MVVKKVMRWSRWAPKSKSKQKREYQTCLTVTRLEGLFPPLFAEGDRTAVRIEVKAKKRKDQIRVTREKAVKTTAGAVDFREEDDNGLRFICGFSESESGTGLGSDCEVSFLVLHGIRDEAKKERKLEELGMESVNLVDWLRASQSLKQNGTVERKKSQVQVQRKQLPISLVKDGLSTEALLCVNVSFEEMQSSEKTSETVFPMANKETIQEEEITDSSNTFEPDKFELSQLLAMADETEKVAEYKSRNRITSVSSSSGGSASSSPEHFSKRGFLSWGKKSKISRNIYDYKERESGETRLSSISSTSKELQASVREKDPIGGWESKEFISRDRQTKLKSQTFFASIDQRDESAGGESACTALVAVIAHALHTKPAYTLTRSEIDALIKEGSLEWQILCNDASYINRFPNKHFDLDTILEAKIRPISVSPEKSFVGFFQPESFESLCGAMSFDDIWSVIAGDVGEEQRVYIVSWNDHFFVLKADFDAYYIMDTLGERLYEGCTKAYMLKFDDSTEMYRVSEINEEGGDELICSGKECCREFIKRFLAAIPLREELELEEKRTGNANTALHQRLQIEFHLTVSSFQAVVIDDTDWW